MSLLSHLTSLDLSFLTCKTEIIVSDLPHCLHQFSQLHVEATAKHHTHNPHYKQVGRGPRASGSGHKRVTKSPPCCPTAAVRGAGPPGPAVGPGQDGDHVYALPGALQRPDAPSPPLPGLRLCEYSCQLPCLCLSHLASASLLRPCSPHSPLPTNPASFNQGSLKVLGASPVPDVQLLRVDLTASTCDAGPTLSPSHKRGDESQRD